MSTAPRFARMFREDSLPIAFRRRLPPRSRVQRKSPTLADPYKNHCSLESLSNLTPADVYHGYDADILKTKEQIKVRRTTIQKRRSQHQAAA